MSNPCRLGFRLEIAWFEIAWFEREVFFLLLAIIVPFTSSMNSNLWRGLGVLFGIDIKKKRFYTFMASSRLPWKSLWR
jgi:hypothetical protein